MEANALLCGLKWLAEYQRDKTIQIFGDSALVIALATGANRVRALNLRESTVGPGLLQEFARRGPSAYQHQSTPWLLATLRASRSVPTDIALTSGVLDGHCLNIKARDLLGSAPTPLHVDTTARSERSQFDTAIRRECFINGIRRCVPLGVFRAFQAVATRHHLAFPINHVFLCPGPGKLTIPHVDAQLISAIIRIPHVGIAGAMRLFRGQTSHDDRPNKALRTQLYRAHLAGYPDLPLLCSIAERGVVPHWHTPAQSGVRPPPANYPSAEDGADVVTHRLLKDYYSGRCIIATATDLLADPRFHSSAFALVPKKDIPLSVDGRTIHDLSAPKGLSVNDATNSEFTPDARWDPYCAIALRILDLRTRYPGCSIYALVADIADAFHHVPVHERHAPAFGVIIPRSHIGIVSGMAVFGWTASPGFFAVMGKAARHYQRAGCSYVLGYPEPFWIFQWVDDIVLVEVDIGDRLLRAERRLRDAIKLVFGSEGWHEGKFHTWAQRVHAVGIDWNIPELTVTIPQRKIDKTKAGRNRGAGEAICHTKTT
ncbi:hypothetical protein PHYSODRAFT_295746 [Phytophthora sojae]|uniref:RNase H type-1 domain-containing protein n=1 Tax=Phytophthora sojae (strain P6497) TaxID=1094619 RepID=G4YZ07_PHYSP|nr:hypothetical protein PHYSODRAFT_295746 [Phytophthora sojae]EGZ23288.1 hypothetical protein PHYSODRAFT_295746 [Phytophthora sojae]|eukprot:XP_009518576.1 hypothetical protein PHYSODRAFT_295746 [Phytophthora sojae]